jgi:hypothetical protein
MTISGPKQLDGHDSSPFCFTMNQVTSPANIGHLRLLPSDGASRSARLGAGLGLINHTHTAATKLFYDTVVRDGLPDQR